MSDHQADTAQQTLEEDLVVFPASFGQKRLWFLDQFEPGSPYYNIPAPFRLRGSFDIETFRRTINEIVRRHESLRTTFIALDGQPMQVISEFRPVEVPVIDLRQRNGQNTEEEMFSLTRREARMPFDLATGPLFRVKVLKLSDEEHVVLVNMHHIISDGWSIGVLAREIGLIYGAFVRGLPSPLPDLSIQYVDYSEWQREWFQGDTLTAQLAYWKKEMEGAPELLDLPTDRPRQAVYTNVGSTESTFLSESLMQGIHALARSLGASPFMVLLSAFQALLHRYSGQDDLCVGTPIANRTQAEVEELIGLFINTLVLRARFHNDPTARDLINQVRETTLSAFAHQDLPFEMLLDELHVNRDMSHSPLFQAMFILQNAPAGIQRFPGLTLEQVDVDMGTATFDLTFSLAESPSGYSVSAEYNTDLFEAGTIRRMLMHYRTMLEEIVHDPTRRVSEINYMREDEERQVLVTWSGPQAQREEMCAHRLIEAVSDASPDAIAVSFEGHELTYNDLNVQANKLAHFLIRLGVGAESRVGIYLEKSPAVVVSFLAVMKAGGAYVPFDPINPAERLAFMLEDSGVKTLLTTNDLASTLPHFDGVIVRLDVDADTFAGESGQNPDVDVHPDNLAYMIYTSGTTGKSKGTMVSHRSLVNAYAGWEEEYTLKTVARSHLQMASVAFDVFTGDVVRALCSGGKLVLCPREYLLDAPKLYALMNNERVTIAEFVPAVLRNLVEHLKESGQDLSFMSLVIAGSDIWYVREYKELLALLGPQTRLIDSFGLTEATIDSSFFEAASLDLPLERLVPIGRPFPNSQILVLDQHLRPVPVGVTGEVYVGGLGLARGYHRRSDLTAEKFLPNPYALTPGERLYRTGDLGRFLPDGNIEFLGRKDHQVKVRGFRVELGEIETALSGLRGIKDGVAIVREDSPGDRQIVAYVVPQESFAVSAADLRARLLEKIPDYMVPTAFVTLGALPLTANGKVDRKSLPRPEQSQEGSSAAYEAPTTRTEEAVASIWKQILNVGRVSIHDDFFLSGGHSLRATQLVSRLRSAFHIDLPLRTVFESPTVAGLAAAVDAAVAQRERPAVPAIVPVARDENAPLSFAQERLWFLDQLEPASPVYNIPEIYRVRGSLDVLTIERCFNEVIRRHETLRTGVITVDGKPKLHIAPELRISIPLYDMQGLTEDERARASIELAEEAARKPIPLDVPPLVRISLVRFSPDDHVIVVVIHHIISDEWSTTVFMREVAALYDAFVRGLPSPLPELPIQYVDFAAWQKSWLQGDALNAQLDYWKHQLGGTHLVLEMPADRPRPAEQTFNGSYTTFWLSREVSQALRELGAKESTTLFMTVLAAFQTFLFRYTGQADIAVGTPIANRDRRETEGLIGFFVNTLVMRTDLSGEPCFRELLRRIREVALGAYAHQDVPFEKLVDMLEPQRDLSHSPLFQVMLVVQNAPTDSQASTLLSIAPVEVHSGTAKFDLTLFIVDGPDRLGGALEYNTDLFDKETAGRMVRHFETLVSSIVENPERPLSTLCMLSAEERHCLIEDWNPPMSEQPSAQLLHEMFCLQAERTPESVALAWHGGQFSYRDLEERSGLLAAYLTGLGVGPEVRVGIALERSSDMIVSMLAVLRAGGVYVPLDRSYPAERLSFIMNDAEIRILLTINGTLQCSVPSAVTVVALDHAWPEVLLGEPAVRLTPVTADNLAYVIYTSGSTGKPKGTMITHGGLANYLRWCLSAYPLDRGSGSLVHSTIAFDATVTALFPPLLCGKTVRLLPETEDPEELARELGAQRDLSLLKITPAHLELLNHFVAATEAGSVSGALVIGGENLTFEQIQFWLDNAPATELFNEYGPTEAVVGCIVYRVKPSPASRGSVPIGRPIPNSQAYILDAHMEACPTGVVGELYLGGIGVARGYVGRSDLTSEKFLPDPFSGRMGARLYRTGDLARYRGDGTMEFLGRSDDQVKIRGYRIETGEIESILQRYEGVREAVVIAREDKPGERRLVGYIVPRTEFAPTIREMREFLKTSLPEYMIPSSFVQLESIPLTVNGKVDKRALPLPDGERPEIGVAYEPPSTHKEETLAEIVRTVLGLARVGVNDNFFELGGDSILSIQVVARAQQAGLRVTARELFQNPTVRALSAVAREGAVLDAEQGIVTGATPLGPIQRWFFEQEFEEPSHWNQSLLLEVREPIRPEVLEKVITSLEEQHDALRLRFLRNETGWASWGKEVINDVPLSIVDLSSLADVGLREVVEAECAKAQASLDIEQGPLMKVVYMKLGDGRPGRLLIVIHHLVVDGVSWRILMEDFQTALTQAQRGTPVQLPPKTTSFKKWTGELEQLGRAENFIRDGEFWRYLSALNIPSLPADFPGGVNDEASSRSVTMTLGLEETSALLHQVHGAYHTNINDVLLAALVDTLTRWMRSDLILIDLEGHGREDVVEGADVSRTVGWFTAMYPIALQSRNGNDKGELLVGVKEQMRRVPDKGLGYTFVRYFMPDSDLGKQLAAIPSPQVSFNYLGVMDMEEQGDSVLVVARENRGPERSPRDARTHLLEIDGGVSNGRLQLDWTYSSQLYRKETIEQLSASYLESLKEIIRHCLSVDAGKFTASDFSEFGWSEADLNAIATEVTKTTR